MKETSLGNVIEVLNSNSCLGGLNLPKWKKSSILILIPLVNASYLSYLLPFPSKMAFCFSNLGRKKPKSYYCNICKEFAIMPQSYKLNRICYHAIKIKIFMF